MTSYKIGIDIGGTFTDGLVLDESNSSVSTVKVMSTPSDPSIAFLNALDRLIDKYHVDPREIGLFVHGTTVATNSIIEGKTAKTAFITTSGFRDILQIAFQIRSKVYDIFVDKPTPLIPRRFCFEVRERLDYKGNVLESLNEDDVYKVVEALKQNEIESVAICLLHSYANDTHEKAVARIVNQHLPDVSVTISSEICNKYGEYTRGSTAVINASIIPVVKRYLDNIKGGLQKRGVAVDFHLMQSNGGIVSSKVVRNKPATIVESGPAAGVIAAQYIGELSQLKEILLLDIGGTTAKVGMILNGQPIITHELEVGAVAFSRSTAKRASGYPLRTPSIDLVEIGAGGGSIAWVDSGGILRSGPQSAGASPGPACYPNGGGLPTLTDANVVLGRLNPDYFLGGEIKLDKERATDSIKKHCAERLGRSVIETALGIVAVAVSNMVQALRFVTVERGYDPRDFCLVAIGGAGPLHANLIAKELGISQIIVPKNPGIATALGLLVTDIKHEVLVPVASMEDLTIQAVESLVLELVNKARNVLREQNVGDSSITTQSAAGLRYSRQSYQLKIEFDMNELKKEGFYYLNELFHKEHERAYGFALRDEEVKIDELYVTGLGKIRKHTPQVIPKASGPLQEISVKEVRQVFIDEEATLSRCVIHDRNHLKSGNIINGPAIVEEIDSTTLLLPHYEASVDLYGNLVIGEK